LVDFPDSLRSSALYGSSIPSSSHEGGTVKRSRIIRSAVVIGMLITWTLVPLSPAAATSGELIITSDTMLTEDHDGTIVVRADGVTLDCGGHTVSGHRWLWYVILVDGYDDVGIRNCLVTDGLNGIAVVGLSERTLVAGNTAFDNEAAGIAADRAVGTRIIGNEASQNGGNGIQVIDVTGVNVTGNASWQNGRGIGTAGADTGVFRENTLHDNRGPGLSFERSAGNVVDSNLATRNGDGFAVLASSMGNRLTSNLASANDLSGFLLDDAHGNTLTGNVSRLNGFSPDEARTGFDVWHSSGNLLRRNRSAANASNGYYAFESSNNTFHANTATRNTHNGFGLDDGARSNTLIDNLAVGNGESGFFLPAGATENQLTANEAKENRLAGFSLHGAGDNVLVRNEARGNGLDEGYSGYDVYPGSTQNVFRANLSLANGDNGFYIEAATENRFVMNRARSNPGSGFSLSNGANDNIFDQNVSERNAIGMSISGSSRNVVTADRFIRNGRDGEGWGVWVTDSSEGNRFVENIGRGNAYENFAVAFGSSRNVLLRNISQASGFEGISLYFGAHDNVVRGNQITVNTTSGVLVYESSNNTIRDNRVLRNNTSLSEAHAGISVVQSSSGNAVFRNIACGNGIADGYDDHTGSGNLWSANTFCTGDV
jgi:parallel beta-helix repeat protein